MEGVGPEVNKDRVDRVPRSHVREELGTLPCNLSNDAFYVTYYTPPHANRQTSVITLPPPNFVITVVFFNRLFHYAYCQIFLSSKTVKHCDKGIDSCGNGKSGLPLISSYCNTCVYILQSNLQCCVIFYLHLRFV